MRVLLDSHVFIWAKCAPERLSDRARAAIIDPDNEVYLSLASAWELWLKHAKKRVDVFASVLDAGASAFLDAAQESGISLLDITLEHASLAASLPPIHRDPFDRMLIAQALTHKLTVLTTDAAFKRYLKIRVLDA